MVSEPGDGCLVDEWSYSNSLTNMKSVQVTPIPVKMDAGGLDPKELDILLAGWDENAKGMLR